MPSGSAGVGPLGLYIHVPFCRSRCGYCTFTSTTDFALEPSYTQRLVREIHDWGRFLGGPHLDTLYMGGGTPSLLPPASLRAIGRAMRAAFDVSGLLEATLEANPGTVSEGWLEGARNEGWDRISLGVQTLDDGLLRLLGRTHSAAQCFGSVKMCLNAGFERVCADLLLGVPTRRPGRTLEDAVSLIEAGVEHLSVYILDLDKDCPLKGAVDGGLLRMPDDGEVAEEYLELWEKLPRLGFCGYEISNFSRPGRHSAHNVRYWRRRPYIGLGPGAAGNIADVRWAEGGDIAKWLEGTGTTDIQRLTPAESLAEIPLLGLRMSEGVDWPALHRLAEDDGLSSLAQGWDAGLDPFMKMGLLVRRGNNLCLTPKGALLSNAVFRLFV